MISSITKRYRGTSQWARGVFLVVLGLSYPSYYLYDQTFAKKWQLNQMDEAVKAKNQQYQQMLKRVQSIDALRQNIGDLEAEFAVAQDVLPEALNIEQMLLDVARIARKSGVKMQKFQPERGMNQNEAGQFAVKRIALNVVGAYAAIVSMMDDLVHLNYPLQIENIAFLGGIRGSSALRQFESGELDLWKSIEKNSVTVASMSLVYFHALDGASKASIASQEKARGGKPL